MTEIKYVQAKASDVASGIDAIMAAVNGEDEETVMLSCVGLAILMQDPEIAPDKFLRLIKEVSEYIALAVAGTEGSIN